MTARANRPKKYTHSGANAPAALGHARESGPSLRSCVHRRTSSARWPIGAPEPVREIPFRPSRVIHFLPPHNPKMVAKVPDIAPTVDVLLANLEDAVPASEKENARAGLVEIGKAWDHPDTQFWTRVNSLDSPWVLDDLTTAVTEVGDKLDVIMIPKVEGPEDIHYVDRLLAQLEARAGLDPADPRPRHPRDGPRRRQRRGDLRRVAADAGPVARPGRPRRQPADEDDARRRRSPRLPRARRTPTPTRPMRRAPTYQQDLWHYTIARMVDACVTYGVLPYYGPFGDIADTVACEDQFRNAYLLGCVGAWSLHPAQIEIAKRVFSPPPEDVAHARRVIEAMGDGTGAVLLDGKMEDDASVKQCKVVVALAQQLAARDPRAGGGVRDRVVTRRSLRPRRSVLYMPSSNERALEKAKSIPCDAIIFDLEDAVAPDSKPVAREQAVAAVTSGEYGHARADDPLQRAVDAVGRRRPRRGRRGAARRPSSSRRSTRRPTLDEVAAALDAAGGIGDVDLGDDRDADGDLRRPRDRRPPARRRARDRHQRPRQGAAGAADPRPRQPHAATWRPRCWRRARRARSCSTASTTTSRDADGFAAECRQGVEMGFDGKTLVHPSQVEPANAAWSPTADEIELAARVIAAYEEAEADGRGVVTVDGRMIEHLHVANARRTLAIAQSLL